MAFLAIGLSVVAGGLLALWTSYLASDQESFEPFDVVLLRFLAAVFVGMLIVQVLVAKRCWQADQARWNARRTADINRRTAAEDFNQQWLLSLLQKKVAETREKVSTSAADVPGASEASSGAQSISS